MRTEAQLQRRAMKVLESAGITEPPVDPVKVAQSLGAVVRSHPTTDDISGALYFSEDGAIIGVNETHAPNRKRFTIAHECGHLVLHREGVYVDRAYASGGVPGNVPAFLRNAISSEATNPLEIEANRFAACLLMPRAFLLASLRGLPLPLTSDLVASLADTYRVSSQAMGYRLANLNVPLDVGS